MRPMTALTASGMRLTVSSSLHRELSSRLPPSLMPFRTSYIPDSYIANPRYKLELYRRFADMAWGEEEDLMDEIIDRFGTPPEEVELLWHLAKVRAVCRRLKVRRINVRVGLIRIIFAEHSDVNGAALVKMVEKNSRYMQLLPGTENVLLFRTAKLEIEPLEWLEKNLVKLIK